MSLEEEFTNLQSQFRTTNNILTYSDFQKLTCKYGIAFNKYREYLISTVKGMDIINLNRFTHLLWLQQDFYILFYLSLKIIKNYYLSDSNIVCLGESPNKIIFAQSLFYDDKYINSILIKNNYPKNLEFKYLPLSKLGKLCKIVDSSLYVNADGTIKNRELLDIHINEIDNNISDYFDTISEYFNQNLILNINNIIANPKKTIFVDRVEYYRSISTLLTIYRRLYMYLSPEDKLKFVDKILIVGFDGNYDTEEKRVCNNIYMYHLLMSYFNVSMEKAKQMYKFYAIPVKGMGVGQYNKYIMSDLWGSDKIINYSSLPEVIGNSRCVKTFDIRSEFQANNHNLEKIYNSGYCNFINYITYLIFIKIKNSAIMTLIYNIDKIDQKKLFIIEYSNIKNDELDKFNNHLYTLRQADLEKFVDVYYTNNKHTIFNNDYNYEYPIIGVATIPTNNNLELEIKYSIDKLLDELLIKFKSDFNNQNIYTNKFILQNKDFKLNLKNANIIRLSEINDITKTKTFTFTPNYIPSNNYKKINILFDIPKTKENVYYTVSIIDKETIVGGQNKMSIALYLEYTNCEINSSILMDGGYYNKYNKYKLKLNKQLGGEIRKILYLDFDETLGSFHMNLNDYYRHLIHYKIPSDTVDNILKKLLNDYYLRSNIKEFFKGLQLLKETKKIDKIIINTRNSDKSERIPRLVKLIEIVTETSGIIDNIIWASGDKNITTANPLDIVYIVDDKCEHVIPEEKCIPVKPYLAYVDHKIIIDILKENGIPEEIITDFSTNIIKYQEVDFSLEHRLSYTNQYKYVHNFNDLYKPTKENLFRNTPIDTELLRVLEIIKTLYI